MTTTAAAPATKIRISTGSFVISSAGPRRLWRCPAAWISHHAAKAEVACRGVDRLGMPRGGPIATAIVRRAQMRAALDHLARDFDVGKIGIVACFFPAAARIFGDAACL